GAAFCACASASEVSVAAATIEDVPNRRFRRLIGWSGLHWSAPDWLLLFFDSLLMLHSLCCSRSFVFAVNGERRPRDAAEADMAGRSVDRLGVARGRAVAAAVMGGAEMRAALQDLAGNSDVGEARVVACSLAAAAGILRDAAGLC